ncbi:MAG: hypothetical protein R3F29_02805 [Planctomycetota bacterium]
MVLLAAMFGSAAAAQQRPPKAATPKERATRSFTTDDGSRFVLVVDDSLRQLHWATATWNDGGDDPPGLEGLTEATLLAARGGTWPHGSKDEAAERAALEALDAAWHEKLLHPQDPAAVARVVECDQAAARLGDPRTFPRVLAAAPAHRPEVLLREPVAVHVVTTIEEALPDVAALLVERREQQPLRGLYRAWTEVVLARAAKRAGNPAGRLHAELLALMMPLTPAGRQLEAPPAIAVPRRAQALACWQATQHPTRTVHLLFGAMDADRAEAVLRAAFATTLLPAPQVATAPPPRPLTAERRSIVDGADRPRLAIAWALPPGFDRWTIEVAARWLGDAQLTQRMARAGHQNAEVTVRAPWPRTIDGASMLLVDVADPDGIEGLLEIVLETCRAAAKRDLTDGAVYQANMALQHDWNLHANDPRQLAAALAEHALLWPTATTETGAPPRVKGADVSRLLRRTFAGRPAVVEGRR